MRSGVRLEGSSERSHNERFWNGRLWRKADVHAQTEYLRSYLIKNG
jgi:hypothetical protein